MRHFGRILFRFLVVIVIEGLSLLLMAWIISGISITAPAGSSILTTAISIAIVLAILNGLIRPLLVLLTLPISMITVGFFTLVINALMLMLTGYFSPYFYVENFGSALLGAIILSAVNTVLTGLTSIDDDYSFYDGVVQWLSKRRLEMHDIDLGRGIVMLEIDGLSYERAKKAIESGVMPNAQKLLNDGTHLISHTDCGLPSQTSACQAGIMYGDNHDIPAFRWYDKEQGRLYASSNYHDAAEINGRYSNGQGLLREGTSINNMMSGDAQKALLTMSVLVDGPDEVDRRNPADLYLVFVNPYFFTRTIVLTIYDIFVEIYQALRQRIRNVRPRINRFEKAYPLVRGVTVVLMRDVSAYTIVLNLMKGSPAIYTTFVGYDEVAHHSGPDTEEAFDTLRGIDKQLGRILDVIKHKAPRLYDVFLLSDHGQSFGATFKQRYGQTLSEYLEELVQAGASVTEINATESAQGQVNALIAEINHMHRSHRSGRVTRAVLNQATKTLERPIAEDELPAKMDSEVVACVSGNLANVYFDLHTGKVNQNELETAHPGLLDSLVNHEGIGLVVSYDKDGDPWVLSKSGGRNLLSGEILNQDPLGPYGDPELRATQLLRLAQFPHSGDLIVISTLYQDGQVAAFEELVGCHGGLGGQQTDSFIFHPADMEIPPTSNSRDVFAILNSRRGLTGEPLQPRPKHDKEQESWKASNLAAGIRDIPGLISRASRAIRLDRKLFQEVADDPLATGQALLILAILFSGSALADAVNPSIPGSAVSKFIIDLIGSLAAWFLVMFLALAAGRALKGQASFSRTFRTVSFALMPEVITWLQYIPGIGPLFNIVGTIMILIAVWWALQEALHLSKWRALFIPIVALIIAVLVIESVNLVIGGTVLTIETLLNQIGFSPTG